MNGTNSSYEEQKIASEYFTGLFEDPASLPLSFVYGGKEYRGFDSDFAVKRTADGIEALHSDGLLVKVGVKYDPEYAQCEWTLGFENTGKSDSAVLSSVYPADMRFTGVNPVLSSSVGDRVRDPYAFARIDTPLRAGTRMSFFPIWGKSTGSQKPYYRLDYGNGGMIIAIGWHGRWKADFFADDPDDTVRFRASQFRFGSYLKTGESVKMPSLCMIKYSGRDRNHAINCWRRWYYDRAYYRYNGKQMSPKKIVGGSLSLSRNINEGTFHELLDNLDRKLDSPYDLFWVDAGWYYKRGTESLDDRRAYWNITGTWRMDESRFPTKMKSVTDRLRKKGAEMLLWFEPERATVGTELYDRDDLCMSVKEDATYRLADMGNPEFRRFMIGSVEKIMKESGAAIYRQDFNFDPYRYWVQADAEQGENRCGITENHYVNGIHEYYREIHSLFPEYPIDMCASGGMRNDISVMRDSVMLTFTDTDWNNFTQMQNMRLGMFEWYSSFGGGTSVISPYAAQSNFAPFFAIQPGVGYILDPDKPYDGINRQFAVWEQIKDLMFCDYYPLTGRYDGDGMWCAWEFSDPGKNSGFAQFFRRPGAGEETKKFRLFGLDAGKTYRLTELNSGEERLMTGDTLMSEGIAISIPEKPGCALWKFVISN